MKFLEEMSLVCEACAKARKVYDSWGGIPSNHEQDFTVMNMGYPEVFYTYKL